MQNYFSPLEQFDTVMNIPIVLRGTLDISFTSVLVPLVLTLIFFYTLYGLQASVLALVPGNWQYIFEYIYSFIYNLVHQQVGLKGHAYLPLIFSLFAFVLSSNLLSMSPYGIALTSHIVIIMFLSVSLGLSNFLLGIYTHGVQFFKLFVPEAPLVLLFPLIFIEIFSYIIRTFSLAIRLSANIMAGHTLVFIISTSIGKVYSIKSFLVLSIAFLGLLAILMLELAVAFLQAYVFTILFCIYLSDALNSPSH